MHERKSRLLLATRQPNKAADRVARHLVRLFESMPPELRKTITFDNGTEFARHRALHRLAFKTFFCAYAPGRAIRMLGRMRRFIPPRPPPA